MPYPPPPIRKSHLLWLALSVASFCIPSTASKRAFSTFDRVPAVPTPPAPSFTSLSPSALQVCTAVCSALSSALFRTPCVRFHHSCKCVASTSLFILFFQRRAPSCFDLVQKHVAILVRVFLTRPVVIFRDGCLRSLSVHAELRICTTTARPLPGRERTAGATTRPCRLYGWSVRLPRQSACRRSEEAFTGRSIPQRSCRPLVHRARSVRRSHLSCDEREHDCIAATHHAVSAWRVALLRRVEKLHFV